MSEYKMIIKADENDADYRFAEYKITDVELKKLKPIIEKIKNFKPYTITYPSGAIYEHKHNYPMKDHYRPEMGEKSPRELYEGISEEEFEYFESLLPTSEFGLHTIVSIELYPIVNKIVLL